MMISTIDLTKAFGQIIAVDKITLQIEPGELFGFLGPNGAGKTTTINMLTGLIRPTSGTAIIGGVDVSLNPRQVKAITGLVPDTPKVYETLTGRQFVRFMANLYEVDPKVAGNRMEHFLEIFDLVGFEDDLIKGYSYGMQKKILLTAVLVHKPRLFFLDEPTSGLDPKSARLVKEILRDLCDEGHTVFMTTHILEIAEKICDRIAIIKGGKLIAIGTIDELRNTEENSDLSLEDIFLELTEDRSHE